MPCNSLPVVPWPRWPRWAIRGPNHSTCLALLYVRRMKEASGEIEKQKIVPVNKAMLEEGVLNQAQAAAKKFFGQ